VVNERLPPTIMAWYTRRMATIGNTTSPTAPQTPNIDRAAPPQSATVAAPAPRSAEAPAAPSAEASKLLRDVGPAALSEREKTLAPAAVSGAPARQELGRGLGELLRLARGDSKKLPAFAELPRAFADLAAAAFRGPGFPGPDAPGATSATSDPMGQIASEMQWTSVPYEVGGVTLTVVYQQDNKQVPRYLMAPLAGGGALVLKLYNWELLHEGASLEGRVQSVMLRNALGATADVKVDAYGLDLQKMTFFTDGAIAYGSGLFLKRYDAGCVPSAAPADLAAWLEGKKDLALQVKRRGKAEVWMLDKATLAPPKGFVVPGKI